MLMIGQPGAIRPYRRVPAPAQLQRIGSRGLHTARIPRHASEAAGAHHG